MLKGNPNNLMFDRVLLVTRRPTVPADVQAHRPWTQSTSQSCLALFERNPPVVCTKYLVGTRKYSSKQAPIHSVPI
jgi:hypothetical protein